MKFRLTVRDNQTAAGGVDVDEMNITVAAGAGPFLVTAPNTAVTWNSGQTETVAWDVANTDQAPVNCSEVDIRLSLDGGYTYPVLVEANRPNDGSEEISVPNAPTTQARIKVACSANIFFDISDNDFTIVTGPTLLNLAKSVSGPSEPLPGDILQYTIVMSNMGMTGTAVITDVFPAHLDNISCNGVPGDLFDMQVLGLQAQVTYTCTAEIDPTLAIGISKVVDQAEVMAGTAVTYTITVTNPQTTVTLTNVMVADPNGLNCLPALSDPVSIGPGGTLTYVCANNVISQSITNTAVVTGFYELVNVAEASLVGESGVVMSNGVSTAVALSESAAASVEVALFRLYLPWLRK